MAHIKVVQECVLMVECCATNPMEVNMEATLELLGSSHASVDVDVVG